MQISKEFKFEAAHRLPSRTKAECQLYGKCSRLHGHSYRVVVHLKGDVDASGWIVNFDTITAIAKELIEDRCDHMFLHFNGKILEPHSEYKDMRPDDLPTTAENMAQYWFDVIDGLLAMNPPYYNNARVAAIEVWETAKCRAICDSPSAK